MCAPHQAIATPLGRALHAQCRLAPSAPPGGGQTCVHTSASCVAARTGDAHILASGSRGDKDRQIL
eukprot:304521-Chlamydomonas_euryale.AAC.1